MSALERGWHYSGYFVSGFPCAIRETWKVVTNFLRDIKVLALAFVVAYVVRRRGGQNDEDWEQAVDSLKWAFLVLAVYFGLTFLWNLVVSYPRRNWNLNLALESAQSEVKALEYERDFYKHPQGRSDPRLSLIAFLEQEIVDAVQLRIAWADHPDARRLVDTWSAPITKRLALYDSVLAIAFDDDGGERFTSLHGLQAFDRRIHQLALVISDLKTRGD